MTQSKLRCKFTIYSPILIHLLNFEATGRNTLRAIFDSICDKIQALVEKQLQGIKKKGMKAKVGDYEKWILPD